MSVPVCSECDACHATPVCSEDDGDELWEFNCIVLEKYINTGWEEDDALPKTSPRWCPKRKAKKEGGGGEL